MSAVAAPARAVARDTKPRLLRALEPAAARGRRPRLMYGVVAVAGAIAIGTAQMALSILTTQSTYELSALNQTQRELTYRTQILYDEVAGLSSPQFLAANAAALGMVIDESPTYLRLSDGAIVGTAGAAAGASSVDAIGRAAVPNALITDTPLITAPDATIEGTVSVPAVGADAVTPPPITDGLPSPATH